MAVATIKGHDNKSYLFNFDVVETAPTQEFAVTGTYQWEVKITEEATGQVVLEKKSNTQYNKKDIAIKEMQAFLKAIKTQMMMAPPAPASETTPAFGFGYQQQAAPPSTGFGYQPPQRTYAPQQAQASNDGWEQGGYSVTITGFAAPPDNAFTISEAEKFRFSGNILLVKRSSNTITGYVIPNEVAMTKMLPSQQPQPMPWAPPVAQQPAPQQTQMLPQEMQEQAEQTEQAGPTEVSYHSRMSYEDVMRSAVERFQQQ